MINHLTLCPAFGRWNASNHFHCDVFDFLKFLVISSMPHHKWNNEINFINIFTMAFFFLVNKIGFVFGHTPVQQIVLAGPNEMNEIKKQTKNSYTQTNTQTLDIFHKPNQRKCKQMEREKKVCTFRRCQKNAVLSVLLPRVTFACLRSLSVCWTPRMRIRNTRTGVIQYRLYMAYVVWSHTEHSAVCVGSVWVKLYRSARTYWNWRWTWTWTWNWEAKGQQVANTHTHAHAFTDTIRIEFNRIEPNRTVPTHVI